MPYAAASAALRPVVSARPVFAFASLHRLRLRLEQRRQRRLDRVVAEAVLALDHTGIAEDYRAASRRGW